MTAPERLTLDLPHLRFAALAWGPKDGRLMLCLHGYPDSAWTWRHLGPHFAAQGFRVVAPFMRGYAPTELARDGDYGLGALMYDAVTLHEALGGTGDAVLVGHDWGGLASAGVAAYPKNTFGTVVSMGVPVVAGMRDAGNRRRLAPLLPVQMRMSWYILFQQIPWLSERNLGRVIPKLWRDWCPPGYDAREDLAHLWEALPDTRRRTAALAYYRAALRPWRRGSHAELDRYAMTQNPISPMLVLHGRLDGAIDVRIGTLSASVLVPGSRHEVIDGAGHFMHLDRPDEVHALIADYANL